MARLFDALESDFTSSVSLKALNDTTTRTGDAVTPEVATLQNLHGLCKRLSGKLMLA